MGFWDNVEAGFKNIFSGIGKAVKSAFSPKNWWKTLLIGTAVVVGGAALGYWNTGITSLDGAFKGGRSDSNPISALLGSEGELGKFTGQDSKSLTAEYLRKDGEGNPVHPNEYKAAQNLAMRGMVDTSFENTGMPNTGGVAPDVVTDGVTNAQMANYLSGSGGNALDSLGRGVSRGATNVADAWDAGANTRLGSWVGGVADSAGAAVKKNPTLGLIAAQGVAGAMDDPVGDQIELDKQRKLANAVTVPTLNPTSIGNRVASNNLSGSATSMTKEELEATINRPVTAEEWAEFGRTQTLRGTA
jgi:hypothetical protein